VAIIKFGVSVVGIRGTIGGMIFSANKNGPFARAWSQGANPRTTFQSAQRSTLASIPALWRALTPAEKLAWDVWAALPAQDRINRLGETFSASGFTWFTIVNVRLLNIQRVTRTAPPTQSRPAAPTLSSLVLPFLDQQATKVTYPSGEFLPAFDQVIEIAIAISTGRTVAPTTFLLLRLDPDPPDEDNEFVTSYLERWNLAGHTLKGFANLYRQTTDGLRSSPGTASFISTDTPPYAATAEDYDGATNYALRGADLSANANSFVCLFSIWFRIDAGDGTARYIIIGNLARYYILLEPANTILIVLRDTAGANNLVARTTSTFLAGATWHNIIWSVNLATGTVQLAVDGVIETPSISVGPLAVAIDWTQTEHAFGGHYVGTQLWDGCLSEAYFNNQTTLDLTVPQNLARFADNDGYPVDLGATGAFPTGRQPICYFRNADPSTNRGYGGNFVNQAALNPCSTDPP
jgi:hypothetical protein